MVSGMIGWYYVFIMVYLELFKIVEVTKEMRDLEPRALAYISAISKTPKEQFRCYAYRQLNPQHWNF